MNYFYKEVIKIKDKLVNLRRELHKYPEIGMQEYKTSKLISNFLSEEGIELRKVAQTGVCGIIRGTKKADKDRVIALRADIDGLPIEDKKTCDYASSINGVMHACGHDAHTTILLGVAKILNENKHLFSGTVKLMFEPAEETVGGSRFMIEDGVLDEPNVDVICGLHVEETLECGKVMVRDGAVNASSNPFIIKIKGSGGHGAYPHNTVDPIVVSSNVIVSLQSIISREINPINSAVLTIGSIHGGTAQNVIPDDVEIRGIIRTFLKEDREFIKKRLVEVVEGTCKAARAKCEVRIEDSYPSLYNDEHIVDLFKGVASEVIGMENVVYQENPKLGVESFAYFANERPSVFYFLGSGNKSKNIVHPAHSSLFDIDEDCLTIGVAIQCELVLQYLTRS